MRGLYGVVPNLDSLHEMYDPTLSTSVLLLILYLPHVEASKISTPNHTPTYCSEWESNQQSNVDLGSACILMGRAMRLLGEVAPLFTRLLWVE